MAELVTLYNEKLNSLFRLCYTWQRAAERFGKESSVLFYKSQAEDREVVMTGGIAKVVIFSFTERGTKQNRYIYRKLKMQGYICEGYAPAKYVMGEEGGVKQLPKKKEDLIRERWGKWAFLFIGAAGIAVRYIAP